MKKRTFTIVGVLIAVIILAILVGIGSPLYLDAVENAKAKVCATNLETLKTAVDVYGEQNNALPGSLSLLRPSDIKKAWAKVFKKENPLLIKMAYFLVDFDKQGLAYASNASFRRFAAGDSRVFTCPDDKNGPPSYGINSRVAGLSWKEYSKLPADVWIIADCDSDVCSFPVERHKRYRGWALRAYAQKINRTGKAVKDIVIAKVEEGNKTQAEYIDSQNDYDETVSQEANNGEESSEEESSFKKCLKRCQSRCQNGPIGIMMSLGVSLKRAASALCSIVCYPVCGANMLFSQGGFRKGSRRRLSPK